MTFVFQGIEMPEHLAESLNRYVEHGIETGRFLRAVLENDLLGAVKAADHKNLVLLPVIVCYVYNELPSPCWGSKAEVAAWLHEKAEARAAS